MNKFRWVIIIGFLCSITNAYADTVPCPGSPDDPGYDPNNCPIDTWIFILATIILIPTIIYLNKKSNRIVNFS